MKLLSVETFIELLGLYSDYAVAVDSNEWERWPDFFIADGVYRLKPRENEEQGLPLCLLSLESQAMMRDRVYGVRETLYHDPYYQRHIVGVPRILSDCANGGPIVAEANYVVVRTKLDGESSVFSAGFYHDEIVATSQGLRFKSRTCIYDSEMILNSVIYPI
jgi:salicylate 5-hydroxylase small subunit